MHKADNLPPYSAVCQGPAWPVMGVLYLYLLSYCTVCMFCCVIGVKPGDVDVRFSLSFHRIKSTAKLRQVKTTSTGANRTVSVQSV